MLFYISGIIIYQKDIQWGLVFDVVVNIVKNLHNRVQ